MCYGMMCHYQDYMGDCTIHCGGKNPCPDDAACVKETEEMMREEFIEWYGEESEDD